MFHGRISLNLVLLLLLVSGFWLELMYISFIEGIRSNITHLHGFQQFVQARREMASDRARVPQHTPKMILVVLLSHTLDIKIARLILISKLQH